MSGLVITPDNSTLNRYFLPLFKSGRWTLEPLVMRVSIAMNAGAAVYARGGGNGDHDLVTGSTQNFKGILMEKIAATDADYAVTGKTRMVAVPLESGAEAEFAVGAGTFVKADIGENVVFNDSLGLAVDTAGTQASITRYKTATRGVCKFNLTVNF